MDTMTAASVVSDKYSNSWQKKGIILLLYSTKEGRMSFIRWLGGQQKFYSSFMLPLTPSTTFKHNVALYVAHSRQPKASRPL